MKSPRPRVVVRLRLTLLGIDPAVWRDIIIDKYAPLSELHQAIQLAFDGDMDAHHLFRSTSAGEVGLDESLTAGRDWPPFSADPYRMVRTRSATRWGNRWTMIDLRDPTVEDESSVTVGNVVHIANPLFYSWQASTLWSCRVDAYEDAVLEPSSPRVALTDGANRAPLSGCPDAATYDGWLRILEETAHDDHIALREMLDRAVGPWARFDPAEFDVDDARSRFAEHFAGRRRNQSTYDNWHLPPLEYLVRQFPESNRPGLRRHIQRSAVRMPAVVTRDDAAALVRPFHWLVTAAGDDGIAFADGSLPGPVVRDATENLPGGLDAVRPLVAAAKQLGLLYLRRGRLHAPRAAKDAHAHPLQLWQLMATQLLRRRMPGGDELTNTLFLLALADGSLADDSDAGLSRIIAATKLIAGDRGWLGYDRSWPGYDRRWRERSLDLYVGRDEGFVQPSPYERWRAEHRGSLVLSEPSEADRDAQKSRLLAELAPLIRTLAPLGLARTDEGAWIVPDGLREFARAALT
ncbi:hypothetical protein [uncultured Microbacterium sp.]|uniref:IS1096 element passenger TnpR family protein n=1 Tax=uncultured Microbacterium sp. TaxID=191216 RepID=UPI0035CAF1B0